MRGTTSLGVLLLIACANSLCAQPISFEKAKAEAEAGSATAQNDLGAMYATGQGVTKDPAKAAEWYRKAANQGDALAQNNLGSMYVHGNGVPVNTIEGVTWYRKAAEQNLAVAQYNLGLLYAQGTGVAKDNAEAVAWYLKAAEQGYIDAQHNLGVMYGEGGGVTKNPTESARWYRKAAEQGYGPSQYNLGLIYKAGNGVTKDAAESSKWFRKAADKGQAESQNSLGLAYESGIGLPKDAAQAVTLYRQSASQGYAPAQYNLARMYRSGEGVHKDVAEATKWERLAAVRGFAPAQHSLGVTYAEGEGVSKNPAEAAKWYSKAARQGYAAAQNNLGLMYWTGEGVRKDYVEAYKWLTLAAENGVTGASQARSELEQEMTHAQIAKAKGVSDVSVEGASETPPWAESEQGRPTQRSSTKLSKIGLVDVAYSIILLLLAAPFGFALEKRRKTQMPNSRPYTWGYSFGCMLAAGCALRLLTLFFCETTVDYLSAAGWSLGCAVSSFLVLKRRRWGWLLGTVLTLNPGYFWINWIYARNRWAEFKTEAINSSPARVTLPEIGKPLLGVGHAAQTPPPQSSDRSAQLSPSSTADNAVIPEETAPETRPNPPSLPDSSPPSVVGREIIATRPQSAPQPTAAPQPSFSIIGVDRQTGNDVELTVAALTEANARVKAELKNIVVTSVAIVHPVQKEGTGSHD